MLTVTGLKRDLKGVSLRALGMRIQLGHTLPGVCRTPTQDEHFLILDAHGMHKVAIDYCGCKLHLSCTTQLHAARLVPSREAVPRSAAACEMAHLMDPNASPISMRARVRNTV